MRSFMILLKKIRQRLMKLRATPEYVEKPHFSQLSKLDDAQWRAALTESPETAARWVYSAAVYGDIDAQLTYAQMLLDGHGMARDSAAAYRWFEIAARSNRADALNLLGRCHELGWGAAVDISIAAQKYRSAAEQSYDWAQFNLACLLLDGQGIARDPDEALALLSAAAAQGHVKSLNMIGLCHENGWGCPPDAKAASHWFHRAAEAGDSAGNTALADISPVAD